MYISGWFVGIGFSLILVVVRLVVPLCPPSLARGRLHLEGANAGKIKFFICRRWLGSFHGERRAVGEAIDYQPSTSI